MHVRAGRRVSASAETVFSFLQRPDHVLELLGPRACMIASSGADARIRLRGRLGVRRTMTATIRYAKPPESIVGRAYAGRSRATMRWSIQRSERRSWVEVAVDAYALAPLDVLLLSLGGRRWLERSLNMALERLDDRMGELDPHDRTSER